MRAREINKRIERLGGVEVGQKGSHRKYRALAPNGVVVMVIVPQHNGEIAPGTLRDIRKAGEAAFGKGWLDK